MPAVETLFKIGCHEVSLGDTTGRGTAKQVSELCKALQPHVDTARLAGHFHDTFGQGVANVLAAFHEGLRIFDSAVAGLGGCPYAPGASGNLATEDLVYLLEGLGVDTGVDKKALAKTGRWITEKLGITHSVKTGQALLAGPP